jgi:hypothetical protein
MRIYAPPLNGRLLCAAVVASFVAQSLVYSQSEEVVDDLSEDPFYNIRLPSGMDYSTGKYGTSESTDIWYVSYTAKLEADRHAFKLTVPYLSITDSGSVVGGGDQVIVVGDNPDAERSTEDGLGDLVGVFSYYLFQGTESLPMVDVNYKIKFPTADDDRGLGTGKFDHAIELDFAQAWGNGTIFSTAGYKIFGDPSGYDLKNVFYGSIGGQYRVDEVTRVGLIYDIRDNTTQASDGISEITAYVGRDLGDKWKFMLYGVAGLSDGSPDWGAGITFSRSTDFAKIRQLLSF